MKLNQIIIPKGIRKRRKRLGHGVGSGRGKTCGRGMKGQTSRSGRKPPFGFEGGQMPLARRIPKRGFRQRSKVVYQIVNVENLNKLKKGSVVNPALLKTEGLVKSQNLPIKVLAKGALKKPLTICVHKLSAAATQKIKAAGGEIKTAHKAED